MASGSRALSPRARRSGAIRDVVARLATWPTAWTPASVRLAPVTLTGSPKILSAAAITSPCTVGRPGCACQPWKSVPSYARVRRRARKAGSADEELGDLNPVERGALAELVTHHPEVQRIGPAEILADAADVAVVLTLDEHGHGVALLRGIVPEGEPGEAREELARPLWSHRHFRLRIDRHRVRGEHGDAHRGGRDGKVGSLEDLPDLVDQLHLFPRVAALHELVDVRDDIERDLVIEEARRDGFATGPGECLLPQLVHAADALEGLGSYLLHSNRLALEEDALAHRPLGGEGAELLHGKLALVENLERGLSHGSRHPDYGNR